MFFFDRFQWCIISLLISDSFFFSNRITLGLSSATWVLPASHLLMAQTLMPPCSSPLLFFSPHSNLVISWQQPLRPHHHHLLLLHHPHYLLGSQSLLLAILLPDTQSASLCSSSRGIFSSPHHRYVCFSIFLHESLSLKISLNFKELVLKFWWN